NGIVHLRPVPVFIVAVYELLEVAHGNWKRSGAHDQRRQLHLGTAWPTLQQGATLTVAHTRVDGPHGFGLRASKAGVSVVGCADEAGGIEIAGSGAADNAILQAVERIALL